MGTDGNTLSGKFNKQQLSENYLTIIFSICLEIVKHSQNSLVLVSSIEAVVWNLDEKINTSYV